MTRFPTKPKICVMLIKQKFSGPQSILLFSFVNLALPFPSVRLLLFNHSVMSNSLQEDCRKPVFPVLHHLLELAQTHVHWVGEFIQPFQPLLSPSPAFNLSHHQSLFWWAGSSHQLAKVLELQFQHQSFQWLLAIWPLIPLSFLNPSWTSGSSWFMYWRSLYWRILSIPLLACEMIAIVW